MHVHLNVQQASDRQGNSTLYSRFSFAFEQTFNPRLLTQENVLVGGFFVISGYVSAYTTTKLGALGVEASLLNMWYIESLSDSDCSLCCNFIHCSLLESKSSQTNKSIRIPQIVIIYMIDPTSLYPSSTGRCSRTFCEPRRRRWQTLSCSSGRGCGRVDAPHVKLCWRVWREGLWLQTEVSSWAHMLLVFFWNSQNSA